MRVSRFGIRTAVSILLLQHIACFHGYGQAPAAPAQVPSSTSSSVPLSHLYWHFLMYQNHLDQEAAQMEKEGKSGAVVRSFIQTKLNMSDNRYEPIHRASDRLSAAMANLNSRAQHLRSLYIQTKPPQDGTLTPEQQNLHDQLKRLNVEREQLLAEQMNTLDNELAVDDRAAFREFLTKQIAPRVTVTKPASLANQPSPFTSGNSGSGGGK
jgi:hypothetical protein